ncbi:hypothetical protein [Kibdelosporangium aridum]|uniref:hypothetical protein n=1 Tax=Kibdelosporangium aridum TaxID=2030 RepID=UPI00190EDC02|nr:hypothetical protein [Kibdelosporangium aridum]
MSRRPPTSGGRPRHPAPDEAKKKITAHAPVSVHADSTPAENIHAVVISSTPDPK